MNEVQDKKYWVHMLVREYEIHWKSKPGEFFGPQLVLKGEKAPDTEHTVEQARILFFRPGEPINKSNSYDMNNACIEVAMRTDQLDPIIELLGNAKDDEANALLTLNDMNFDVWAEGQSIPKAAKRPAKAPAKKRTSSKAKKS